jgi:hypothetical protein
MRLPTFRGLLFCKAFLRTATIRQVKCVRGSRFGVVVAWE